MANTIRNQTRIANEAFYEFEQAGTFVKHVGFKSGDFDPASNVGGSYTYRRPGKITTTQSALAAQGSTPTPGSNPGYSDYTEPVFPLVVARKFRQAIAISSQDLTLSLTGKQAYTRGVKPAAQALKRQIELYAAGVAMLASSQVIGTPGTPSTGDTLLNNFNAAASLFTDRGIQNTGGRVALVSPTVKNALLASQRALFNPSGAIGKGFLDGAFSEFGGTSFFETPLLPGDAVVVAGTPALTVSGANQSAGAVWTPTWNLTIAGTADLVIPPGMLFTITNTGLINWVRPDVFTDSGVRATFRVVTGATLTGGTGTIVVTEPLIGPSASNGYQNVTELPANGATIQILNDVAAASPSLVFDEAAILGVSPIIQVPEQVKVTRENIDGINLAFIQTYDPLNMISIWELQAMVGFAVGLPEAVATVY